MQIEASKQALVELDKTTEKDAFRAIGSVIVKLPVEKIKADLTGEQKKLQEQADLIDTQVKRVEDRMMVLKNKIERALTGQPAGASGGDVTMASTKSSDK